MPTPLYRQQAQRLVKELTKRQVTASLVELLIIIVSVVNF